MKLKDARGEFQKHFATSVFIDAPKNKRNGYSQNNNKSIQIDLQCESSESSFDGQVEYVPEEDVSEEDVPDKVMLTRHSMTTKKKNETGDNQSRFL